jgi:hypothetical protein
MNAGKIVLFTALGLAAVLLLTTDKANRMRNELNDLAMKNAKKLKDKMSRADHNGMAMADAV